MSDENGSAILGGAVFFDVPVMHCPGYSAKASEQEAREIGIREFCMKPMNIEQLAKVARKELDEGGKSKQGFVRLFFKKEKPLPVSQIGASLDCPVSLSGVALMLAVHKVRLI